jgi:hypothetical protein
MKRQPRTPSKPSAKSVTPLEALLRRIRAATFPADAKSFRLEELSAVELDVGYTRPKHWHDSDFCLFVLLATQAKELRREIARLRPKTGVGKDWKSMPLMRSFMEPCPIKQAELERQAKEEKRIADEQRRKQLDLQAESAHQADARKWKRRDEKYDLHRFRPALWHEPMTLLDYHAATGISRRTLQNILDRAALRPVGGRVRPNDPARYDQPANAYVLCQWLTHYVKDPVRRKALIARTLLHCEQKAPERFSLLLKAIYPAFESLGVTCDEFANYVAECRRILHPPPPASLDPFGQLCRALSGTAASG